MVSKELFLILPFSEIERMEILFNFKHILGMIKVKIGKAISWNHLRGFQQIVLRRDIFCLVEIRLYNSFFEREILFQKRHFRCTPSPFLITVYQMTAAKKYSPRRRQRQPQPKLIYFSEI